MNNENELSIVPEGKEIISLEKSLENAQKYIELMATIRTHATKLTNANDWSNQGGKPYLEKSGCDKIAMGFGIRIIDPTFEKEAFKDDKGEYFVFTCSGSGVWNNHHESEIGTCSTRDDFFCKKGGNLKPLSEIDITNIKKKAFTNFANRIIKKLLGLSFTWEELSKLSNDSITADTVTKVEFQKGSKGGSTDSPETKKLRDECRTILLKLCDGEENVAKAMLKTETEFTGKDGNVVAGKEHLTKLSEKQIKFLHAKLKKKVEAFDKAVEEGYGQ